MSPTIFAPLLSLWNLPWPPGPPYEMSWAVHSSWTVLEYQRPTLGIPCLECNSCADFQQEVGRGWGGALRTMGQDGWSSGALACPGSSPVLPTPQPNPSLAPVAPEVAAAPPGPGRCAHADGP